jgi:hypothetical protein
MIYCNGKILKKAWEEGTLPYVEQWVVDMFKADHYEAENIGDFLESTGQLVEMSWIRSFLKAFATLEITDMYRFPNIQIESVFYEKTDQDDHIRVKDRTGELDLFVGSERLPHVMKRKPLRDGDLLDSVSFLYDPIKEQQTLIDYEKYESNLRGPPPKFPKKRNFLEELLVGI